MRRPTKAWWLRQPSSDFLRDPYFYMKYDLTWATLLLGASGLMWGLGWRGLELEISWMLIPLALVAAYLQMCGNAFIHNASHGNWPRPINRLVGEIFGVLVMTRYASWEILHRRHHMFSDDEEKDPHPMLRSYWAFLWKKMIINLERNLHQQYYELWGDSPEIRRRELVKSWISAFTGATLFLFWFVVMGPVGFVFVFVPAAIIGILHLTHFNWATHDADRSDDFRPVNRDEGIFWLGNRILFGVYMHANHHAYANVFNPLKLDPKRAARVEDKIERMRP
jgi:stearoyl-CoA desaturase (delta-9 desaturase)